MRAISILQVLVDGVSNPAAVTSGTYTFTNVTANHTIGATFDAPLAVTAPNGGESFSLFGTTNVTWTVSPAHSVGSFDVWVYSPTTSWYQLNTAPIAAVAGQANYSMPWTVGQPPASDYKVRVWYRDAGGNGVAFDDSNAVFAITPFTVTATAPNGGETFTEYGSTNVTWSLSTAVSSGSFDVWVYSPTTSWYQLNTAPIVAVAGQANYSMPWTVGQPPASDYKVRVWYRDAGGNGVAFDDSNAVFAITPLTLTVTAPNGGEVFLPGSVPAVTWSVSSAVSSGSFDVWVYSPTTSWYKLNSSPVAPVAGQVNYTFAWTVAQPPATDYKIRVWYIDTAGNGVVVDDSNAVFTIL